MVKCPAADFFVELSDPNGGFFYPSPTIPLIPLGTTASGLSRLNPDLVPDDQKMVLGPFSGVERWQIGMGIPSQNWDRFSGIEWYK